MRSIVGNGGGPYTTYLGAQDVHIAESHDKIFNELFHLHTGVSTTIVVAVSIGDTSITVASDASFIVGDAIQINNGNIESTFPIITAKPGGNVLTLDRPLDFAYAIDDTVDQIHHDLSTTAGSLASPIIHKLEPIPGEVWYLNRVVLSMVHATAADDSKFGGITKLTNGVVLRSFINGQFRSFTNWKANSDLISDMFDVTYSDKAGGGAFGTSGRFTFTRVGVIIALNGNNGDYMDIVVQDNLTTLTSFFVNGQGYIEVAA